MDGTARLLGGLGLAAGIAGATLALASRDAIEEARTEARAAREAAAAAGTEAADAREAVRTTAEARRARAGDPDPLEARIAALEARTAAGPSPSVPGPAAPAAAGSADPARPDPALAAEYDALRKRFFAGDAKPEETARLFEILKSAGFLPALLADLEARVAAAPGDADGRLELADAYIAKLFTVPPGPEMGVWGAKAEDQWKEILRQDDRHWQARFNLAFSWSQYPEFLNKTPDSIREFERLRTQQEEGAPGARHADTYFHLHSLHRRMGNAEKAKEALAEGLRRFPDDPGLRKVQEAGR
jgi:hypothetical protein